MWVPYLPCGSILNKTPHKNCYISHLTHLTYYLLPRNTVLSFCFSLITPFTNSATVLQLSWLLNRVFQLLSSLRSTLYFPATTVLNFAHVAQIQKLCPILTSLQLIVQAVPSIRKRYLLKQHCPENCRQVKEYESLRHIQHHLFSPVPSHKSTLHLSLTNRCTHEASPNVVSYVLVILIITFEIIKTIYIFLCAHKWIHTDTPYNTVGTRSPVLAISPQWGSASIHRPFL